MSQEKISELLNEDATIHKIMKKQNLETRQGRKALKILAKKRIELADSCKDLGDSAASEAILYSLVLKLDEFGKIGSYTFVDTQIGNEKKVHILEETR